MDYLTLLGYVLATATVLFLLFLFVLTGAGLYRSYKDAW